MSKPKDSRAFACVDSTYIQQGMSLREWYAGQVLPEVCRRFCTYTDRPLGFREAEIEDMAKRAFAIADAMIKESEK